ncbi:sialic acid TRAP transporter substrate-binding protein SiaP [Pannonibacter indicus]|uniref:TRAP-type C4-dicarboxylate transport system, periplasmic component n=1 Tax=Pannonibacter indicus TaxID=466044 RepID=A0A0K6HXT6_9HYPH|nr:sialic acid TRAP transporter substrate-binding protein SiaP [Pannonibacter indicus]CUA95862.1 TRAP-type C4-dicarboxylate transport system, periplasmic component [Pannonibacter indicus]
MDLSLTRRKFLSTVAAFSAGAAVLCTIPALAAEKITLRMSTPATETDSRTVALSTIFAPAIAEFAEYQPHYNASLFKQGTELEAIARGNLEMAITSAQELAAIFPEFSIFTAGYLHKDAEHQKKVFAAEFMQPLKQKVEDELGVKLLSVMYLGRRQLNLRTDKEIKTPADLAGIKLRMPGSDAWQFLGKALGASPVPMAFTEVYTGLQTGAIDGQDNPLPTNRDMKFYEVTKQIVLTSHLVDLNYIAFSKKVWDSLTAEQQAAVQKAADEAAESGRQRQLALEAELEQFFKDQGLKVYTPDIEAFRTHVQKQYLESDFSKSWPEGMVDQINAL